jgi:hypothetical protein
MGENEGERKPFRFLGDAEFKRLDAKDKAMYLVRAQQELEEQQNLLRGQRRTLTTEIAKSGR